MALNEEMERRLIYAKYLFLHGQEHARDGTAVGRMIAIHNFDNAVELILKCIASKYFIKTQKKIDLEFKDLWNEIIINEDYKRENTEELPLKREIFGLHDLRNRIQHHGDIPSNEDIIKYMGYADDFFKKVLYDIFDLNFDELSLASLIDDEEIKSLMKEAEKKIEENDFEKSIKFSSKAFYLAAIRLKKNINEMLDSDYDILFSNYSDFEELGIPYLDFVKFFSITSRLTEFPDKLKQEDLSVIDKWDIDSLKQTKPNAQYCLNFALKYILKWQSFWKEEV